MSERAAAVGRTVATVVVGGTTVVAELLPELDEIG